MCGIYTSCNIDIITRKVWLDTCLTNQWLVCNTLVQPIERMYGESYFVLCQKPAKIYLFLMTMYSPRPAICRLYVLPMRNSLWMECWDHPNLCPITFVDTASILHAKAFVFSSIFKSLCLPIWMGVVGLAKKLGFWTAYCCETKQLNGFNPYFLFSDWMMQ
jgi:hypothetical protein